MQRSTFAGSCLALATLAIFNPTAFAQSALSSGGTIAIPTYESVGLYWQSPGGTAGCEARYRKAGETAWKKGLDLWYDARDAQCRGSLVSLDPDTAYQVELNLPGQAPTRGLAFRTWANQMKVARTIMVNSGSGTYNIAEGGSAAGGYVVYQAAPGAVLDARDAAAYNVTINASYVILRGLTLKGAQQDAIRISPDVKDVVIEDNDVSGWGRRRVGNFGIDMDSGIRAVCKTPTLERVTIQRNRIHDPRYSANSWSDGHPSGPQAITISYCGGNHVIRHNEMYSTNGNYFNDVIGGEDNFTKSGFPNADTDIYANRISNGWDDGIEAEGANENVRIWGNYIDRTAIGVATTVTSVGPVYIFRNVWNRAQMYQNAPLDQDDRQPFFKSGSDASLGNGRRYVFHNTMLQAQQAGLTRGLGGGNGMGGTGSASLVNNTVSKNNIYHTWKPASAFFQVGTGNDIANDMYSGTPGTVITNGINATPVYAAGAGWTSEANGNYQLASGSPGFGKGAKIVNFNDDAAAPDVGAHQSGRPAMKFGLAAAAASTAPAPAPAPSPVVPPPVATSTGIAPSATALDFSGSAARSQTVTYTNRSALRVTFVQASMSSGKYGQSNNCGDVAPGASCTATVTYYPTNSGPGSASYTLTSTAPNSPHVVQLSDSGAVAPAPVPPVAGIATSAGSLAFTSAALTRQVTYTNKTASRVTFIQASTSSGKFGQSNNCGDVAPGASCTATVTYYPTNGGALAGTITLTSSAPNSPHIVSLSAS